LHFGSYNCATVKWLTSKRDTFVVNAVEGKLDGCRLLALCQPPVQLALGEGFGFMLVSSLAKPCCGLVTVALKVCVGEGLEALPPDVPKVLYSVAS
jgi:hypothetical protein